MGNLIPFYLFFLCGESWNNKSNHWIFRIIVHIVIRGGRACVHMISACCDSGAAVCTNTWLSFVGKYNWGWCGVDTSSCLHGAGIKIWHPQRSSIDTSWAWSQRKCLSPPLSTLPFSLLHNHKFLSPFSTLYNFSCVSSFTLFTVFPPHPNFTLQSIPLPLQPKFLSQSLLLNFPLFSLSLSSPLQILSSDTTLIFCQLFFPPWTSVSVAQ